MQAPLNPHPYLKLKSHPSDMGTHPHPRISTHTRTHTHTCTHLPTHPTILPHPHSQPHPHPHSPTHLITRTNTHTHTTRVKDASSGALFALKHLRLNGNAETIADVQHEAKTMAKLRGHPNILRLHAVAFAGPRGAESDGFFLLDFCPATLLGMMQARGSRRAAGLRCGGLWFCCGADGRR